MFIRELLGFQFKLDSTDNPWTLTPSRKLNYRFGVMEGLLNIYGSYPADVVLSINSQMKHFQNEHGSWDGNYPERMRGWIPFIIELLKKDPDSRRAVIPIYGPKDLKADSKDICCTTNLQFLVRDGKLNLIVTMRSNDALLGLANDVVQFAVVQKFIAACLNLPTGWYIHQAGSMHIYEKDVDRIMAVLNDGEKLTKPFPQFTRAWSWDEGKLEVDHFIECYGHYQLGDSASSYNTRFGEPFLSFWKLLTKQHD